MSAISTYLHQIITAIWAKDVRQAIHDAISQCYDDVNAPALQTEAMQAAVQAKIDAGEMAALTIADGSLTGAKLANGTIPTAKIADGAVTTAKIADGAVTGAKVGTGTLTGDNIANKAIGTAKIDDGAVTWQKLASGAVHTGELADGAVTTAKIADGAVTANKIASGVIPNTDTTLTQSGIPADAKAAGDAIASIEPGLSLDAKRALMVCLDNLEWANGDGKAYKIALKRALQLSDKNPNLPAEYEQVEYIEATGTQYIRTDILSQIPFRVVGDMKLSGGSQPTSVGAGVSSVAASRFFILACPYDTGASRIGNRFANDTVTWTEDGTTYTGGWLDIRSMPFSKTTRYTVESSIENSSTSGKVNTSISCNGYSVNGQRNTPTVGYPIYFFYQSNADTPTAGTLYSCKFYSGSTLIFDAVPCYRKSDNVAGIYDVIGNKFYTNAGTGEFNIGEIVV